MYGISMGSIGQVVCNETSLAKKYRVFGIAPALLGFMLLILPHAQGSAEEGYLVMQYEISIGRQAPQFSLNLAYQDSLGSQVGLGDWRAPQDRMHIPLYSSDPVEPGLFNRLEKKDPGDEGDSRLTIGDVLGAVIGVGFVGLYIYALTECVSGIYEGLDIYSETDTAKTEAACQAAGSGF